MKMTSKSIEETRAIAKQFYKEMLQEPDKKKAFVVGLYGNLGAGKTAFTKEFATILGIEETVVSPTFILMKKYQIPRNKLPRYHASSYGARQTNLKLQNQKFKTLIHIDAYRLKSGEDLSTLGWQEIIGDSHSIVFVEWPEIVADAMPEDMIQIEFEFVDEERRKISW